MIKSQEWINEAVKIAKNNKARDDQERQAAHDLRNEKLKRGQAIADKLIPASCPAVIVAEYEVDDSDSMTDYFASHTDDDSVCVLALSKHDRNNFAEFRNAAALSDIPEVKALAEYKSENEHRENYSMGHGLYLSANYRSGWTIRKYTRRTDESFSSTVIYALGNGKHLLDKKPANATSTESARVGTTWRLNEAKGGVEIMFEAKPSAEVLDQLKGAGFRWSHFAKLWWAKQSPERIELAKALSTQVQ
jgi:hypothetical protein